MKIMKFVFIFLMLSIVPIFGIFNDYETSVISRSMGGCYATYSEDSDGIFYNPAGINFQKNNDFSVSHFYPYSTDFWSVTAFSAKYKLPQKFGAIGFGVKSMAVNYKDKDLMSEKEFVVSHAFNLLDDIHSRIVLGYTLKMYQLEMLSKGSATSFGLNIGFKAILHTRTEIGFYATNLNNPSIEGETAKHDLPQKLSAGISYKPYNGVRTSVEFKKGIDRSQLLQKTEIHAGVEAGFKDIIFFRAGASNNPNIFSAGLGIKMKKILKGVNINYAFSTHIIGDTHHIGLNYSF